jgi:hypothetical protein
MIKIFRGQAGRKILEVREVGKFGRLVRSKIFRGQIIQLRSYLEEIGSSISGLEPRIRP